MFRDLRPSRITGSATLLVVVVALAGCGWTQSRFGPEHTGFNPAETTIGPANVAGLTVRWSAPLGSGATPTVAGGAVYVSSGKLYSLDAGSGSARWVSEVRSETSPAVADGLVYVSGSKDNEAWLYAVDAGSGIERWSQNIGAVSPTAPTVADGVVYTTGDQLDAFNGATGARLWSAAEGPDEHFGDSPTVAGGVAYVGGDRVYAFDATTGARRWSTAGPSDFTSPAVADGTVYAGSRAGLFAFNAATGAPVWSAEPVGETYEVPAVANGVVYLGADELYAFNAATGARLWSAGPASGVSSPAVANGVVYAGHDQVHAFDATTGARLWSTGSGGANASPVVANGLVFVVLGTKITVYGLPGAAPQLSISPAFPQGLVFGNPYLTAKAFTITNLGATSTTVIGDGLSGSDAAHFRRTSDGCAGSTLAGHASCTVIVSFAPTRSGPRAAWLTATAATGGTVRALVTGSAQPFTLSPPEWFFGDRFVGVTSSKVFTVTNLTDLPVGRITNSISASGEFSVVGDACAGKVIEPAASCTFSVRFAPTDGMASAASLVAQAPGHRAQAPLTGRGLSRLAISPSGHRYGASSSSSATFAVTNVSPTTVGPISHTLVYAYGADGFTITSDTCTGRSLAPDAGCAIVVTYAPDTYGYKDAQLRIVAPQSGSATARLQIL